MNQDEVARAHIQAQRATMIDAGLRLAGIEAIVSRGMVHLTFDQFEELFLSQEDGDHS